MTALTVRKKKSLVTAQPDSIITFALPTRRVSTLQVAALLRVRAGETAVTDRCPASLQEIVNLFMDCYPIHLLKKVSLRKNSKRIANNRLEKLG